MKFILPACIALLGLISIGTLQSVAPALAPIQAVFTLLGAVMFLFSWYVGFERWSTIRWLLYAGLVSLLLLTLLTAQITKGTARWLDIAGFHLQGSQLAAPAVGLILAQYVAKTKLKTTQQLITFLLAALLPAVLIMVAPDLGTTLILLASIAGIMIASPLSPRWFFLGGITALFVALISWQFVLEPFQKKRITSFIQPDTDIQGSAYNARQALIAVGSGQLLGRGIGQGVQSHLRFLPERQTDFIFASLAEEWGFIGSSLVVILYALIVGILLYACWQRADDPAYYFLIATMFFLTAQVFVNVGMNMQLMPITGITLPFVSYGGSSFIALCFHFGIVQSILSQKPITVSSHFS